MFEVGAMQNREAERTWRRVSAAPKAMACSLRTGRGGTMRTPLRVTIGKLASAKPSEQPGKKKRNGAGASRRPIFCGRRERLISEEIIGHRRAPVCVWIGAGKLLGGPSTLALLQEPAGEHGRSIFVKPLIEQGSNLFAKVSGVGQAGQLEGL
jgi:hypothetical protein